MDWPGVSVAFSGSELLCASDHSGTRLAAAMLSMVSPRRTGIRTPLSHNSTSVFAGHEIAQRHRIGLGLRAGIRGNCVTISTIWRWMSSDFSMLMCETRLFSFRS